MEPHKSEIDALREVMFTPVESFVTEKERAEKGDEWAEKTAHRRMFATAIKAAEEARGQRTLWTVLLVFGPQFYENFGPYSTQAQAEKARAHMLGELGNLVANSVTVPLKNEYGWRAMLALADAPPPVKGDWSTVAADAALFRRGWDGKRASRKRFEEMA